MESKIAVVTGANKGIGFAIVKELCKRGVGTVYLTARDITRGKIAEEDLKKEGYNPKFYHLEVTNEENIRKFADFLKKEHGGIDILVNNAAIITQDFYKTTYEDAEKVININYKSLLIIQKYIYPILNENARVLNISSDCGHISNLRNKYWIDRLLNRNAKIEDVNEFVNWYLDSVKNGTLKNEDFLETAILSYRISKIALTALTMIQQRDIGKNISVNALHPGFVQTDMTKNVGQLTIDKVADTPVYLLLDAPQSLKGKYLWFDKKERNWYDPELVSAACHYHELFEKFLKREGKI